jgi:Flp pilus assembly protein TadG
MMHRLDPDRQARSACGAFLAKAGAELRRLMRDCSGNYSMITVMLLPVLVGFVSMGTEVGLWFYDHQSMQGAADAAAYSAAAGYSSQLNSGTSTATAGTNGVTEAYAVAASYGFTAPTGCSIASPAVSTTCVMVNNPPKSGTQTSNAGAFEVIIAQKPQQLFSRFALASPVVISARSVGTANSSQTAGGTMTTTTTTTAPACVVALGHANLANTIAVSGSAQVNLTSCNLAVDSTASGSSSQNAVQLSGGAINGNVTLACATSCVTGSVNGTVTAGYATANPYTLPTPSVTCSSRTSAKSFSSGTNTLNSGTYNGLSLTGGSLTLNAGIFYICPGTMFSVSGAASLTANNATIVLLGTGTSCATLSFNTTGTITLIAPASTTDGYQGIAIADAPACVAPGPQTAGGNQALISGGTNTQITGAIVLQGFEVTYAGGGGTGAGVSTCTQLIADSISFSGSATLNSNCSGAGTTQATTQTTTTMTNTTSSTTTYAPTLSE